MVQSETLESHMAKPSWCLLVIVMYFMPAAFASATQAAGSNSVGLNWRRQLFILRDRHFAIVHHPLAVAEHGVHAPMDEQAEPGVLEPFPRAEVLRARLVGSLRGVYGRGDQEGEADKHNSLHHQTPFISTTFPQELSAQSVPGERGNWEYRKP